MNYAGLSSHEGPPPPTPLLPPQPPPLPCRISVFRYILTLLSLPTFFFLNSSSQTPLSLQDHISLAAPPSTKKKKKILHPIVFPHAPPFLLLAAVTNSSGYDTKSSLSASFYIFSRALFPLKECRTEEGETAGIGFSQACERREAEALQFVIFLAAQVPQLKRPVTSAGLVRAREFCSCL